MKKRERDYQPCEDAFKVASAAVREAYDLGYRQGRKDERAELDRLIYEQGSNSNGPANGSSQR